MYNIEMYQLADVVRLRIDRFYVYEKMARRFDRYPLFDHYTSARSMRLIDNLRFRCENFPQFCRKRCRCH